MPQDISGRTVAFIACDGVEQVELTEPWSAIEQAGASPELISAKPGTIQGVNGMDRADTFQVDRTFAEVTADEYDALVIPGGVKNPDLMRMDPDAVELARRFMEAGKPVAAISHGPWLLVEADVLHGRTITSWPSLQTDVRNAGGVWVDEEVHTDRGLVTSRKPDDLPAFCAKLVEEIAEGVHQRQAVGTAS